MSEISQEPSSIEASEANDGRRISRRSLLTGLLCVIGGSVAGGTVAGAIRYEHNKVKRLEAGLSEQTEALAYTKAAELTAALYDSVHDHDSAQHPNSVPMTVLNGEITSPVDGENGTETLVYKNPILLAVNPTTEIDDDGRFLNDAYLGVRGNDLSGRVVISAVRYDPSRHTFTSYVNGDVTLNLAAYVTAGQGGPGKDGLVGFDPTGVRSLMNVDGSPITPGLQELR